MDKLQLNIPSVDTGKAAEGVWIDYEDSIRFKIARANTPAYREAVKKIHRQHKRQIDAGTMSDSLSDSIMAGLMAEHILVDWEGLMNGGEEFPYTKEHAEQLLAAEEFTEIREWIMMQAQDNEEKVPAIMVDALDDVTKWNSE